MKNLKETFKKAAVDFWNDEEAQGMIEYILIMVAVVGIVALVGPKVSKMITNKTTALEGQVGAYTGE